MHTPSTSHAMAKTSTRERRRLSWLLATGLTGTALLLASCGDGPLDQAAPRGATSCTGDGGCYKVFLPAVIKSRNPKDPPPPPANPPPPIEQCACGLDEDGDGKADCNDSDCSGSAECQPPPDPTIPWDPATGQGCVTIYGYQACGAFTFGGIKVSLVKSGVEHVLLDINGPASGWDNDPWTVGLGGFLSPYRLDFYWGDMLGGITLGDAPTGAPGLDPKVGTGT